MEVNRKVIWNQRYSSKSTERSVPDAFLIEHITHFKAGSILDIACGNGRNALFLAKQGFDVTGIDFSEVALMQLNDYSKKDNLNIKTINADLSLNTTFQELPSFDNIVITRYKLDSNLLDYIPSILKKGGMFLYCTFNAKYVEKNSSHKQFYFRPGELTNINWELELIKYISFKENNASMDGYLFKKRS